MCRRRGNCPPSVVLRSSLCISQIRCDICRGSFRGVDNHLAISVSQSVATT